MDEYTKNIFAYVCVKSNKYIYIYIYVCVCVCVCVCVKNLIDPTMHEYEKTIYSKDIFTWIFICINVSGQCYYMMSQPKKYFQMKKWNEKLRKSLAFYDCW